MNFGSLNFYIRLLISGILLSALVALFITSTYLLADFLIIVFLSVSFLILSINKGRASFLLNYGSIYFAYYFISRIIFIILSAYVSTVALKLPKVHLIFYNVFSSTLMMSLLTLFLLIVYWHVVTKGFVRYGEIIARFFLDALPGRQSGLESERRDGVLSARQTSIERNKLVSQSVKLGTLDAGLRLSIANLFVILSAILLFLGSRLSYFYFQTDNIWQFENINRLFYETSSFSILLLLDAILFILPFFLSFDSLMNTQENKLNFLYSIKSNFSYLMFLFFVISIVGIFLNSYVPWEGAIVALIFSIIVFYYIKSSDEKIIKSYDWDLDKDEYIGENINDPFVDRDSIKVRVSNNLLKAYNEESKIDDFVKRVLSYNFNVFSNISEKKICFIIDKSISGEIRVSSPGNEDLVFEISPKLVCIDAHHKNLVSIFQDVFLHCDSVFTWQTWVTRNEYERLLLNGFPEVWKPISLSSITARILLSAIRTLGSEKSITLNDLSQVLHKQYLNSVNISFVNIANEVGLYKIIEVQEILSSLGFYNISIDELMTLLMSDDSEDLFEVAKMYIFNSLDKHINRFAGYDGFLRIIQINENFIEEISDISLIQNDEVMKDNVFSLKSNTETRLKNIINQMDDRGSLPIMIVLPFLENDIIKNMIKNILTFKDDIYFLDVNSLPSGLRFYPVMRI